MITTLGNRMPGWRPWRALRTAAAIIAAWTLIALAWTPPTLLIQSTERGAPVAGHHAPGISTVLHVFLYVLLGFVPWMAVTPLLLRIGRRFALSEGRMLRPLILHVAVGLITVPAVTLAGTLLAVTTLQRGHLQPGDLRRILSASTITAFYTIPTYVAVAAVAQALAYFQRYRQRERLLARAQLQALQAQINPHFLFNTLNAIAALGYRNPARADGAITLLSELMRDTLHERPQQIALKEEIAFVRSYLDLYTLLIGDALQVSFDIAGPAWQASVPTMLLQPLVENAIVHGIAQRPDGGRIAIRAHIEEARLALSISNDVPAQARAAGGNGIGLVNTRERLQALYGGRQALEIRRGADRVTIEISIPFRSEPHA
ncbi:MAG: sensor histidine kinase [Steroidobacterales bacterium]|jgi:hypothetical protein